MSEPLTQVQFYAALQALQKELREDYGELHRRIREDMSHMGEHWTAVFADHEKRDQEVALTVAILRDARKEDQRRAGLRTTLICALATASATLTMGLLRFLSIL